MEVKIFYSWQSTTPKEYNLNFIQDAIKAAVAQVKKDLQIEYKEILIDRDTKGLSGSPNIVQSIDEKIEEADIFIGDFTIINGPKPIPTKLGFLREFIYNKFLKKDISEPPKFIPSINNNVLLEYGQAKGRIGSQRMITVMNYYYGDPNQDNELIPFDISQVRWPIGYYLHEGNYENKSDEKNKLKSKLVDAIKSIIKTELSRRKEKYQPFMVYKEWKRSLSDRLKVKYFTTPQIDGFLDSIETHASRVNSFTRVVGLSGLGKTRLVFRALSRIGDSDPLARSVIYYNVSDGEDNIITRIRDLALTGERIILVLDNCSTTFCTKVKEILNVDGNQLSVVSIGSDVITSSSEISTGENFIALIPEMYEPIIDQIITEYYNELSLGDKETIKRFAKGHTLIASLLAEEVSREGFVIGRLSHPMLIDKLVGSVNSSDERKVIRACSLFERVGYSDDKKDEAGIIAKHIFISDLNYGTDEHRIHKFFEICERQIKRGVLERQGRYIAVRPKPLAISLAVEWWDNCPPTSAESVIKDLTGSSLGVAMCDQMRFLDFHGSARKVVEDLCRPAGPFDNAEVLNTSEGSRLFRSFVDVNPQATIDALYRVFGNLSVNELIHVQAGRRNLIWALEKLIFRQESFEKASKLLYAFAAAENENLSNNATGQFLNLFHIHLAGTEVDLVERLKLIEYGFAQTEESYKQLAVKALGRSLTIYGLGRITGAEKQGSGTVLKDFKPRTDQIREYWQTTIRLLKDIALSNSPYAHEAGNYLIKEIRSFYSIKADDLLIPAIREIISSGGYDLVMLMKNLKSALVFEKGKISEDKIKEIQDLIKHVTPSDFRSQYLLKIVNPSYEEGYKADSSEFEKKLNESAYLLADEAIDHKNLWDNLDILFLGGQSKGFHFGYRIGQRFKSTEQDAESFFDQAIISLKNSDINNRNTIVLIGFITGLDDALKSKFFNKILDDDSLINEALNIAAAIAPSFNDIQSLFRLVDESKVSISRFSVFKYGRALDYLKPEEVIDFCWRVSTYQAEGTWVALSLIYMYSYSDEDKWLLSKGFIKTLVSKPNLLTYQGKLDTMDSHYWSSAVVKILDEDDANEFSINIMNEIIRLFRSPNRNNSHSLDSSIRTVLSKLIEIDFSAIWPLLSEALLSSDEEYLLFYELKQQLSSDTSYDSNREDYNVNNEGILLKGDHEEIFKWCKNNSPLAPARLMEMAPLDIKQENVITWHPFTLRLINEFGMHEEVLGSLSSRMGTYFWIGSVVPLLLTQKDLLKQLESSPLKEVRNWAIKKAGYLDQDIRREINFDEEGYLS
jgi:hypothetical protein